MSVLALTALLLCAPPAAAQAPAEGEQAVVTYPLPDLDIVVRVPLDDPDNAWRPPPWAIISESDLALQPEGKQIIAMFDVVQREFQPAFDAARTQDVGQALAQAYIDDVYAGPQLGAVTWDAVELVEHPTLGTHLRARATVELPDREDTGGQLVVSLYPVRQGLNATVVVGVGTPEELTAAADFLANAITFYDGPMAWKDLPTGQLTDPAGYSLDLPEGFRALTERERTALRGEPVGGNSGYGGALAYQWYFDPGSLAGKRGFGCAAFSSDTLEIVDPAKAPGLADNYRLAASLTLRSGTYQVDGGKPIRGRAADLMDGRAVVVDPAVEGELTVVSLGDRPAYLWRTEGKRVAASGEEQDVLVGTFYTAYADVNLHCQVSAPPTDPALIDAFVQSMGTVSITDGAAFPLHLGLMAQYKQWWPSTNPVLQLYWLPIPIILFAGWLANRGD